MVSNEETSSNIEKNIVFVFLACITVFGSIGNLLVIIVYKRKIHKNETATFFILVLAISDLIVCLVIVPCTMIVEYYVFKISMAFCKSYYFLNTSNLLFSTMLISAIALDRYLCICHPLRQYLTVNGAFRLITGIAIFSFSFGIASTFIVDVRDTSITNNSTVNSTQSPNPHIVPINNSSSYAYICDEIIYSKNHTIIHFILYKTLEKTNHIIFITSIVSVVILYSFIFRVVVILRSKDNKNNSYFRNQSHFNTPLTFDNKSTNCELNNVSNNSNTEIEVQITNNNNNKAKITPKARARSEKSKKSYDKLANDIKKLTEKKKCSEINKDKESLTPCNYNNGQDQSHHQHQHSLISNEAVQNMRSAAMLFVVAVVYIIAFMPVLMISSFKLINFNVILYNLYYLNNAANPLIYCFMNSKFRLELQSILMRRSFYSNPL